MGKKAIKGVLMGYDNDDGYRIWSLDGKKLVRSRDVIFDECKPLEIVNENKNEYLPPLTQDNVFDYVKSKDSSKNEEGEDRSEQEILGDVENIYENPEMRNIERENTETEHDTAEYSDDIEEIDHDMIEEDNIELRRQLRHRESLQENLPK
ncbi:hypothetical protein JTB14_027944 [Gonioctena quinquepunctata]|nr:hypothetical protein JTB14_027944 [Gonioctena quinquepunctata]